MKSEQYDAIIIGVGQAGNPLTTALTKAGWKTAVIERRYVGGTCINDGCTPTKTLIASGRMAYLARCADDYGVHIGTVAVDWPVMRQRKQRIVESFRENIRNRIEGFEWNLMSCQSICLSWAVGISAWSLVNYSTAWVAT